MVVAIKKCDDHMDCKCGWIFFHDVKQCFRYLTPLEDRWEYKIHVQTG